MLNYILNSGDWEEVFKYTGERNISPVIGWNGDCSTFHLSDISRVIGYDDGENDGPNWIGLFELKDGRFAFVTAGCDYTGWGCQEWGHAIVGPDEETMMRLALGDEDRVRIRDRMIKNLLE